MWAKDAPLFRIEEEAEVSHRIAVDWCQFLREVNLIFLHQTLYFRLSL